MKAGSGGATACSPTCSTDRNDTHIVNYTNVTSATTIVNSNKAPNLPDYYVTTVVKGNYVPEVYIDEKNKIIYDVQKYSVTVTPNKPRIDAVVFNNINVQLQGAGTTSIPGTADGDCIQPPTVTC